ncbi:AraC family transcriptional regulator [Bosea caraganae]|uniref:AraC family transcriptional regulator n=1 Tax=Bosea caraganae TaxID=2763117 RepID=A0A370LAP4_9HYPH|nr:helix-turn-helix transcriptional regulator [Bosea caraganae]RDJ27005.1 AraC family transcriptional regulator [Bosea caraganae]RDJ29021.1 AraC family transcriptional regulator [Bosea caraganae]
MLARIGIDYVGGRRITAAAGFSATSNDGGPLRFYADRNPRSTWRQYCCCDLQIFCACPPLHRSLPCSAILVEVADITDETRLIQGRPDGYVRRTAPASKLQIDHHHASLEFDLVVRGAGALTLSNQVYELRPGTLIWMPPGRQHRLNRSSTLEMWVVLGRADLLDPESLAEITEQPSRVLAGEELVDLDRLLSQVAQDSDEPAVYNAGIQYAFKRAWRASRDKPPAAERPMHPAVSRALLLLRESGGMPSLSKLADAAGIGAPYLSRLLVDNTGHSFMDWRNRIRLDRFLEGYRPGANLLKTALDAGFGSYASFHHVFVDLMGCVPSAWVKHSQELREPNEFSQLPSREAYSLPQPVVVSSRLRWARLAPIVSPAIHAPLGPVFLERVLSAEHGIPAFDALSEIALDASVPDGERSSFVASLAKNDSSSAEEFDAMIERHDFAGTFAGLLGDFGLSPQRLADSLTAIAAILWTATHKAGDPAVESIKALSRQIAYALDSLRPKPTENIAQEAHTAAICHFVALYYTLEAVRARGDPRAVDQFAEATSITARQIFGLDMALVNLTSRGFERKP